MRLTSKCKASERRQTQRRDLCLQLVRLFDFYKVHLYVVIKLTEDERRLFSNRWLICLIRSPTCNILTLTLGMHLSFLLLVIASLLFLKMKNWWNIETKCHTNMLLAAGDIKGFFQHKTSTVNVGVSTEVWTHHLHITEDGFLSYYPLQSPYSHFILHSCVPYCPILATLQLTALYFTHFHFSFFFILFFLHICSFYLLKQLSEFNLLHQHSIIIEEI